MSILIFLEIILNVTAIQKMIIGKFLKNTLILFEINKKLMAIFNI